MRPSLPQILIVVLILVLIFGAKRLPDVASSIGKSLKIFKKEVTELREDDPAPADRPDAARGEEPHAGRTPSPADTAPNDRRQSGVPDEESGTNR